MSTSTQSPVPQDHPLMIAWNEFKKTTEYANAVRWSQELGAITINPGPHGTRLTADHPYLDGSLWGVFEAGFGAQIRTSLMAPTVAQAFAIIKGAMQADPDYAWGWHCNIAMAIYDESHPQCICEILDGEFKGHRPDCAIVRAHDARHFNEHALSHEFCNNAAARFMKLCFDVDTSKHPQFIPEEPVSAMPDVPESYGGTD